MLEPCLATGQMHPVSVLERSFLSAQAAALREIGIEAYNFDLDENATGLEGAGLAALADATHLLATVPPVADFDRDPLLAMHRQLVLTAANEGSLRWAGYLSTTSVYGDHGGAWVDEAAETRVAAVGKAASRRAPSDGCAQARMRSLRAVARAL